MKRVFRLLPVVALLTPLLACSATNASDNPDAVKKAFKARFPDREVVSVAESPVKNLFEVVIKGQNRGRDVYSVVYSDAKADYLLVGDLIDAKARNSLTEARMEKLNKVSIDVSKLPLNKAIKDVRGNGSRQLVVFSDPDCPFCKQLERESIAKLDNVTVYTFLLPLAQLHPDAERKSRAIWCSKDPAKTWAGFMREGKALPDNVNCDAPLAEVAALAEKFGISGTPALIFANGDLVPGAIPVAEIEKRLSAKK
ncbi:DsbC family protein [Craterilacuibacter sinensis]|uniref:Thiol:disulfide interchange protein n=1 Tax=Craterilacuibacter sinensis TaxID=2686017 RepID=A0A845BJZ8_9NEIS|nr:DsbC family protein [Craterilacuibacter sinensis]MXR36635.1 thioredoxin fold domain-containing protein [Craterilacuibacter sinensis]RQW23344.1 DsbC family protein [Rhodobacteraceae bacterium CH30]